MGRPLQKASGLSQVTEQGNERGLPGTWSPATQMHSLSPKLPFGSSPKQGLGGGFMKAQAGGDPGVHQQTLTANLGAYAGPGKRTKGLIRHRACPQQAPHLGLNVRKMGSSKSNSKHLLSHFNFVFPLPMSPLTALPFSEVALSSSPLLPPILVLWALPLSFPH